MARHMKHKFEGGKIDNDKEAPAEKVKAYDAPDSNVHKEAEEKKHGGKVKKKKDGGKVEGCEPKHHMGRRARGGKVGSDKNPFSSATLSEPKGHKTDD